MLQVIVGWQIYDITNDPLSLGYVGLALFIPSASLLLPGGDVADRVDRRLVLPVGYLCLAAGAGVLLALTLAGARTTAFFYAALALVSTALAFTRPAEQSFVAFLVPRDRLAAGVAWGVSANQAGIVVGPALGGVLYAVEPALVYAAATALYVAAAWSYRSIHARGNSGRGESDDGGWERLREGLRYVRNHPLILGGMSLDMFAVLLGGVPALLPIFARDILHVGPDAMGALRSAQALGAVVAALALARAPIARHAGYTMFGAVAAFGLATIVFGLSTGYWLSLAALVTIGAANMVSVAVRQTIIQMATADAKRGRVTSVGSLFSGASNELGDFESGVTAAWFGPVAAAVLGGAGTLAVVGIWMVIFPELRRVDRLRDIPQG